MDFFKRVFAKSPSKPELNSSGSGSDGGLFGGLDINDEEPEVFDPGADHTTHDAAEPQTRYEILPTTARQSRPTPHALLTYHSFPDSPQPYTSEFSFIGSPSPSTTRKEPPQNEEADNSIQKAALNGNGPSTDSTGSKTTDSPAKTTSAKGGAKKTTKPKNLKKSSSSVPSSNSGASDGSSTKPKGSTSHTATSPSKDPTGAGNSDNQNISSSVGQDGLSSISTSSNTSNSASSTNQSENGSESTENSGYLPPVESEQPTSNTKLETIAPPSQAEALKLLQVDFDSLVLDFRSRFQTLSTQAKDTYKTKGETFERLGDLEQQKAALKGEVKFAEEEEKYERAADLYSKIDACQVQIDEVAQELERISNTIEQQGREKVLLLKSFHSAQLSQVAKLSQLDMAQRVNIEYYDSVIEDLESEATNVFESKIEMLTERLADVEAELARAIDREQKIESKIASNSQGLSEALHEDGETAKILSEEIEKMKIELAKKEAQLTAVQARIDANQLKMDALRKEQGAYLEDVVGDKEKKKNQSEALKKEKASLDLQLAQKLEIIEREKQTRQIESEIRVSIEDVSKEMSKMADASLVSLSAIEGEDGSGSPKIIIKEAQNDASGDSNSSEKKTSSDNSSEKNLEKLESIKMEVNEMKKLVDATKEEIAMRSAALKGNRAEQENALSALPLLEQSKQAAVSTRDYKEAARLKAEITTTQSSLESLATQNETISKQVQAAQSQLIEQQESLTKLIEKLEEEEARHAATQMERLKEKKKFVKIERRRLAKQPSELASLLHDSAVLVSIAQLEGMLEAIDGEQKYLALKFGIECPADEEIEEEKTEETDVKDDEKVEAEQKSVEESEVIAEEDGKEEEQKLESGEHEKVDEESSPTQNDTKGDEEESSGLFDGLDETDAPEEEQKNEEDENSYVPPSVVVPSNNDAQKKDLESQLEALEREVKNAEEQEDYERAEDLHNQVLEIQQQLSALSAS